MKWWFWKGQIGLQPCKKAWQDVYPRGENPLRVWMHIHGWLGADVLLQLWKVECTEVDS